MKTLISSSKAPLFHIPNPSPWKHKTPSKTLHPKATSSSSSQPRTTQRHKAKGFSGAAKEASASASKSISVVGAKTPDSDKTKGGGGVEEEIPQVVFERMMVRIAVSVGVPMAAGLASLKFFGAVKSHWDIPIWVQILTMLSTFGLSTVGLAYGALSSSWDAKNKGSLLGVEEFRKNWVDMWREEDESNRNNT